MNLTQYKQLLIRFYAECCNYRHHEYKHVADEFGIKRQRAYKAFEIGKDLVENKSYLNQTYNKGAQNDGE